MATTYRSIISMPVLAEPYFHEHQAEPPKPANRGILPPVLETSSSVGTLPEDTPPIFLLRRPLQPISAAPVLKDPPKPNQALVVFEDRDSPVPAAVPNYSSKSFLPARLAARALRTIWPLSQRAQDRQVIEEEIGIALGYFPALARFSGLPVMPRQADPELVERVEEAVTRNLAIIENGASAEAYGKALAELRLIMAQHSDLVSEEEKRRYAQAVMEGVAKDETATYQNAQEIMDELIYGDRDRSNKPVEEQEPISVDIDWSSLDIVSGREPVSASSEEPEEETAFIPDNKKLTESHFLTLGKSFPFLEFLLERVFNPDYKQKSYAFDPSEAAREILRRSSSALADNSRAARKLKQLSQREDQAGGTARQGLVTLEHERFDVITGAVAERLQDHNRKLLKVIGTANENPLYNFAAGIIANPNNFTPDEITQGFTRLAELGDRDTLKRLAIHIMDNNDPDRIEAICHPEIQKVWSAFRSNWIEAERKAKEDKKKIEQTILMQEKMGPEQLSKEDAAAFEHFKTNEYPLFLAHEAQKSGQFILNLLKEAIAEAGDQSGSENLKVVEQVTPSGKKFKKSKNTLLPLMILSSAMVLLAPFTWPTLMIVASATLYAFSPFTFLSSANYMIDKSLDLFYRGVEEIENSKHSNGTKENAYVLFLIKLAERRGHATLHPLIQLETELRQQLPYLAWKIKQDRKSQGLLKEWVATQRAFDIASTRHEQLRENIYDVMGVNPKRATQKSAAIIPRFLLPKPATTAP